MCNILQNNNLRRFHAPTTWRTAFSLAELVISVGILVLLLSLAGQVFNFTVQSTGQATALTGINQTLRMLERTLREDLAHVSAGRSIMVVQGNPANAYWTADGQAADDNGDPSDGYDAPADPDREDPNGIPESPSADVLMFITARKGQSFVTPMLEIPGTSNAIPATSQVQLVTYGMAELGDYTLDLARSLPGAPKYEFDFRFGRDASGAPNDPLLPVDSTQYPDPGAVAPLPASQWHLFRRPTLLLSTPLSAFSSKPTLQDALMPRTLDPTNFDKLIFGESDMMLDFSLEEHLLRPDVLPFNRNDVNNMRPWYLPRFLIDSFPSLAAKKGLEPFPLFALSRLDPSPPPQLATRLGHYFVPNCASFKVEWALDPQSEFVGGRLDGINETLWFDPGDNGDPFRPTSGPDPLRSAQDLIDLWKAQLSAPGSGAAKTFLSEQRDRLVSLLEDPWDDGSTLGFCDQAGYSLQDRFRGPNAAHKGGVSACAWPQLSADGKRPNLAVFAATRPKLFLDPATGQTQWDGETVVPDPMFPGALRITVDLYDHEGRLDRPIRHVMIIPVGG